MVTPKPESIRHLRFCTAADGARRAAAKTSKRQTGLRADEAGRPSAPL